MAQESIVRLVHSLGIEEGTPVIINAAPAYWHGYEATVQEINYEQPVRVLGVTLDDDITDAVGTLWFSPLEVEVVG